MNTEIFIVSRVCRTTQRETITAAEDYTLSIQVMEYPPTETGGRSVWIRESDEDGTVTRAWWRSDAHMMDVT